jgi:hypothetical protein
LRSPEAVAIPRAPLRPLLVKELRDVLSGRALWSMLLILCPLIGYSFFQAVSLYAEASGAARDAPALASGLSPLDGVLVPTFGALYVAVTLLFPFVAIRALGREKETGALRLLVQLPYRIPTLVMAKMAAIVMAWLVVAVPAISTLVLWLMLGGHLHVPETLNLLLGQLIYGLLVGAIALFSASISESSATAAIIALAFTIGSWVLDFALAGQPGLLDWIARLSLTQTLRPFEQGLLSLPLLVGLITVICGLVAITTVWLHPGVAPRARLMRSTSCVAAAAGLVVLAAGGLRQTIDLSEDRRNSFPAADQLALAQMSEPMLITIHLAPEDPRYTDLRRNVLVKLERVVPHLRIRLSTGGQSVIGSTGAESYGEIELSYAGRSAITRSTSPREILPIIYELAGRPVPAPIPATDYPGYPLVTSAHAVLPWFFGLLPFLILGAWWWSRRTPSIPSSFVKEGGRA